MGDRFEFSVEGEAFSGALTIIEATAPTAERYKLIRAWVTQDDSEVNQQNVCDVVIKSVAGTGTSYTAKPIKRGGPAPGTGSSARDVLTAEGTIAEAYHRMGWNNLSGYLWQPVPEDRLITEVNGIIAVRFVVAPAAINVSAGMILELD